MKIKNNSNFKEIFDTIVNSRFVSPQTTTTNFSTTGTSTPYNPVTYSDPFENAEKTITPISTSSILNEYNANDSSTYGGGKTNLAGIFSSLEQGAESQRNIAKQNYETRRSDLLTSLKRFQDDNARDVANQQKTYLANQAAVEAAIAEVDRQNRISAAARGLGGSGLQQLAQLQNLLSQGQTISNLASENQSAMDTLRRALTNKNEDVDTDLNRALDTYNNTLNEIASNLAMNKANYDYQASEAANNRYATYDAQRQANNQTLANEASQEIVRSQNDLQNYLKEISSLSGSSLKKYVNPYTDKKLDTKDINEAREKLRSGAEDKLRKLLGQDYGISNDSNVSKQAINSLADIVYNSKIKLN